VAIDTAYRSRNPEESPLYKVVAGHLETFLARQRERDKHVPAFAVENAQPNIFPILSRCLFPPH
jgi:hypothetical protein